MNHKKNILLTWWTGFIGSHLLDRLISLDYQVIVLIRNTSNQRRIADTIINSRGRITLLNIDEIGIENIFQQYNINLIIHLSTFYKKVHNTKELSEMIYANITFPSLLCELSVKYWIKYFINTGTFFEYAHHPKKINILTEKSKEKAYNLYASTKLAFNEVAKFYVENYEFKIINLRLFSPYGSKDNDKIIPLIIKSIINNKALRLSWCMQKLSFTYIDDIIEAYVQSIQYIENMISNYEIFNIWYWTAISIKDIIEKLKKISDNQIENIIIWAHEYTKNEIFHSDCDCSKAKKMLNRKPKYDITQWLHLTYNYYKNEI